MTSVFGFTLASSCPSDFPSIIALAAAKAGIIKPVYATNGLEGLVELVIGCALAGLHLDRGYNGVPLRPIKHPATLTELIHKEVAPMVHHLAHDVPTLGEASITQPSLNRIPHLSDVPRP